MFPPLPSPQLTASFLSPLLSSPLTILAFLFLLLSSILPYPSHTFSFPFISLIPTITLPVPPFSSLLFHFLTPFPSFFPPPLSNSFSISSHVFTLSALPHSFLLLFIFFTPSAFFSSTFTFTSLCTLLFSWKNQLEKEKNFSEWPSLSQQKGTHKIFSRYLLQRFPSTSL